MAGTFKPKIRETIFKRGTSYSSKGEEANFYLGRKKKGNYLPQKQGDIFSKRVIHKGNKGAGYPFWGRYDPKKTIF